MTRSRLLLDEDRAARSAGLARIYGELGFSQLALAEGFRALNDDPINYSAHRFLADAYLNQPNREIGRLSELLQSQLRQPENVQPLQPQLSETGLFIVPGAGPAQPSHNEYNRLFVRNGLCFYADGIAGANGITATTPSCRYSPIAYPSAWVSFTYQTDGFRPNADQSRDLVSALGQFAISAETSVQSRHAHRIATSAIFRCVSTRITSSRTIATRPTSILTALGFVTIFRPTLNSSYPRSRNDRRRKKISFVLSHLGWSRSSFRSTPAPSDFVPRPGRISSRVR